MTELSDIIENDDEVQDAIEDDEERKQRERRESTKYGDLIDSDE